MYRVLLYCVAIAWLFHGEVHCPPSERNAEDAVRISTKVLIIGGGMAGMAAARRLQEKGIHDFIILEARDQIGGRTIMKKFGGIQVEIGANWCHAADGDPTYELVKKYNLAGKFSNFSDLTVRGNAGKVATKEFNLMRDKFAKALNGAEKLAHAKIESGEIDISVRAALRLQGWEPKTQLQNLVEYAESEQPALGSPDIASLKRLPFTPRKNYNQKDFFITDRRGFGYIIEGLAHDFLVPGDQRLQLGQVVKSVSNTVERVTVVAEKYNVKTIYEADSAIITVSLGVLQQGNIQFTPQLPTNKLENIHERRFGAYMKIFVKFPADTQRFWDNTEWIHYNGHRRGYYSTWLNLEAAGLFPVGTNMLMVTVTTEEAARLERITDQEIKDEIFQVLRHMYGSSAVEPEDILVPRWLNDKFFSGSYTYWPVGYSMEQFKNSSAPVGRLRFSGSAMHEQFTGSLSAAYLNGVREADMIFKSMKL